MANCKVGITILFAVNIRYNQISLILLSSAWILFSCVFV